VFHECLNDAKDPRIIYDAAIGRSDTPLIAIGETDTTCVLRSRISGRPATAFPSPVRKIWHRTCIEAYLGTFPWERPLAVRCDTFDSTEDPGVGGYYMKSFASMTCLDSELIDLSTDFMFYRTRSRVRVTFPDGETQEARIFTDKKRLGCLALPALKNI